MGGGNLIVIGFNNDPVNLPRVHISERIVTPLDPIAMVTCRLVYAMPDFVK